MSNGFCPNTGRTTPVSITASRMVPQGCVFAMRGGNRRPRVWDSTDIYVKPSRDAKRSQWFVSIIVPMTQPGENYWDVQARYLLYRSGWCAMMHDYVPISPRDETCLLAKYSKNVFVWTPVRIAAGEIAPAGAFISMRESRYNPFKVWYSWEVFIKPTLETKSGTWFCSIIVPVDKSDDEYLLPAIRAQLGDTSDAPLAPFQVTVSLRIQSDKPGDEE